MTPHDAITAIAAKTNDIGAAYMFEPATLAKGKELGLDGFRFYFLGRGGVLGNVEPEVVASAFGYFHPGLVAKMWNSGKDIVDPREAARASQEGNHEFGRAKLADVAGLDAYVEAASAIIAAAEGCAMALFAGFRAEPVPDDTPAAAIHQATVLRELRGCAHLVAITSVGLSTDVAHAVNRPDEVEMFGWLDDAPEVTDADRAAWQRAEDLTNEILEPAFSVLTDEQADALVAGTDAMYTAIVPSS